LDRRSCFAQRIDLRRYNDGGADRGDLRVPETPVLLAISDIFKVLDEY